MSHRVSAPTHDEARSLVCLICGEKGSCKISSSLLETIRSHLLPTYDPSDPFLPCATCSTHQKALYELRRGNVDRRIEVQDLSKYHSVRWTRGLCDTDSCAICSTARNNPVGKCGPANSKRSRGRPTSKEDSTPSKVCPSCFGPQAKGITHKCSRTTKLENTLRTLSSKSKEKLCTSVLKDRSRQDGTPNRISLATTSGKNLHVSLLSEPRNDENYESMSTKDLCKLQVDNNLSGK